MYATEAMREVRCSNRQCGRKHAEVKGNAHIRWRCHRCGQMNETR